MQNEVIFLGPLDNMLSYFNHKDYLAGMLMINVLMDWKSSNHLKTKKIFNSKDWQDILEREYVTFLCE